MPNKFVLRLNRDEIGLPERFKARFVVLGNLIQAGDNVDAVFSSVADFNVLRSIFAVAASNYWPVHQVDVCTAFLNGELSGAV